MGLAIGVLALADAAGAQDIVNPTWASIPDGEAMAEVYPGFASMVSLEGDVNLRCRVAPDGTLSLCRVNTAVPQGIGFGTAALALASRFRVNPRQVDGETTKSSVQFTIRFRMEPEETAPPWTGAEPSPEHLAAVTAALHDLKAEVDGGRDLQALELHVDAEREDRVRAMIGQVDAELRVEEEKAAILAFARLLTPGQLADIQSGSAWPARPSEDLLASAGDAIQRVEAKREARLRTLYCAEFDCPERVPTPRF